MNFDFFLDIGISAVLTVLKQSVKNAERKAELKRVMLKIYNQIGLVYGGEDEFVDSAVKHNKLEE